MSRCPHPPKGPSRADPLAARVTGHALLEALGALALWGLAFTQALPMIQTWSQRIALAQSRAHFEADWLAARWRAQQSGSALRVQGLPGCRTPAGAGGWHCGWQVVHEATGELWRESHLPSGVWVTPKPSDGWRVDPWGEPLGGGASVLFQSSVANGVPPELLCLNVLGRLRRLQVDTCSD